MGRGVLERYHMASSTRDMRRSVSERDLQKPFGKLKLAEVTGEKLHSLCDRIVARGAPATAVHARDIVMLVFRYASDRGQKMANPADEVRPNGSLLNAKVEVDSFPFVGPQPRP